MNGNEYSGIFLFKDVISKYQLDSQFTVILLLEKLTDGIPDIMKSFGNNISDYNKDILSVETMIRKISCHIS